MKPAIYTDQMGQIVTLTHYPQRIISLVPSQTEYLFDLGLEAEIVGVTQFCEHPADKVKTKSKIGGTKRFNFNKINALEPDLIIGNKEENYRAGIERLQQHYPVWMSDILCLQDAYEMMAKLGEITGKNSAAAALITEIRADFRSLIDLQSELSPLTVAYFIWRKPYMAVGQHTFIHNMLEQGGFNNVFSHLERYPIISAEKLIQANPQFIFLSSEPYPFKEKHIAEFQALCPNARLCIVNGQLFSWYGSRLRYAANYFRQLRKR